MARTLAQIDLDLFRLRLEVDALKHEQKVQQEGEEHPLRKLAGTLEVDDELRAILDEIEAQRSIPDPNFSDSP